MPYFNKKYKAIDYHKDDTENQVPIEQTKEEIEAINDFEELKELIKTLVDKYTEWK